MKLHILLNRIYALQEVEVTTAQIDNLGDLHISFRYIGGEYWVEWDSVTKIVEVFDVTEGMACTPQSVNVEARLTDL